MGFPSKNTVRTLTAADIPSAVDLSALAGWNQTEADWKRLLHLDREACLAVECEGRIVATVTLICYQDQLAWLGMVLTHPQYRKRGFAHRLVECALKISDARKIRSVKLDATEQGVAIYRSLGFREEQVIERWSGPGRHSSAPNPILRLAKPHFDLDRQAFGADRIHVLNALGLSAFVASDGFALWRPGARASYLGPCVSRSADSAKRLIESCLSTGSRQWYWDVFTSNPSAIQIAAAFDFRIERTLVRMVKGSDLKGSESMIYAGSGFELG